MAEIRQQIRALAARHALARRMRGRPDIVGLAAHLIACQDATRAGNPIPPAPEAALAALPTADEIAALLAGTVEFQPEGGDAGQPVPGGVRHPLVQWSPIVQLARLDADDGRVGGRLIDELPADMPALIRWLEVSMGLRDTEWSEPAKSGAYYDLDEVDEQVETEATDMERAREEFETRFGFSIEAFAGWLFAFRGTDPVLYVLILSREYLLALQHCPTLGNMPEARPVAPMPGLALPPIVAAMTIGELQRLVALYRDLIRNGRTTTNDVREAMGKARSKRKRGLKIARQIRKGGGTGRVFERAPMWAEALRKRLFLIPGRKLDKAERNSMLASWFEGRADWDNAASAERRHGAHELIAATLAPEIYGKSVRGRGLGFRAEPLDLYYGVPHSYLLHLGVTELGRALTGQVDRPSSIAVAARIMKVVGGSDLVPFGEDAKDSGVHERLHKKAVNALAVFLPPFPNRGSAGRFVAVAWLNPMRDASIFRRLMERIRSGDPRLARSGKAGKFYLALWFLQVCFPKLYSHVRARRFGVRITCDLATSASVLTSDPILHSLLLRAVEAMFPKAPRRKPGDPKWAPRTAFPKATKPSVTGDAILNEIARALRGKS